MIMCPHVPLMICYPPGAGGNFLASALDSLLFSKPWQVDQHGTCHDNTVIQLPHYVPSDDIAGMQNELSAVALMPRPSNSMYVAAGHLRNIVALQSLRHDLWFIKIAFDPSNTQHVTFLTDMLMNKVSMSQGWQNCYSDVREAHWPLTLHEFLARSDSSLLYQQQVRWSLQNWFWVENLHTRSRTLELDITDIFIKIPGDKLSQWFNDIEFLDRLFELTVRYQSLNHQLYPDLIKLLE